MKFKKVDKVIWTPPLDLDVTVVEVQAPHGFDYVISVHYLREEEPT